MSEVPLYHTVSAETVCATAALLMALHVQATCCQESMSPKYEP